jgi:hypothetical protein
MFLIHVCYVFCFFECTFIPTLFFTQNKLLSFAEHDAFLNLKLHQLKKDDKILYPDLLFIQGKANSRYPI